MCVDVDNCKVDVIRSLTGTASSTYLCKASGGGSEDETFPTNLKEIQTVSCSGDDGMWSPTHRKSYGNAEPPAETVELAANGLLNVSHEVQLLDPPPPHPTPTPHVRVN